MNRRAFLSFLSVAPVAVPIAAQAMAKNIQSNQSTMELIGGYGKWCDALAPVRYVRVECDASDVEAALRRVRSAVEAGDPARAVSVIEQFQSDLALLRDDPADVSMIETTEPQAHVSPESENEIPTAEAVDLCHSAQDTETLSPNVSRRLHRSWGANEGRVS